MIYEIEIDLDHPIFRTAKIEVGIINEKSCPENHWHDGLSIGEIKVLECNGKKYRFYVMNSIESHINNYIDFYSSQIFEKVKNEIYINNTNF